MGKYGANDVSATEIHSEQHSSLSRRILSTFAISMAHCMINYDEAALDGVVPLIQKYFSITDSTTALLQTLPTITSSIALVIVVVIGDRVEKRSFILFAISLWIILNGLSLLIPQSMYWLFLSLRTAADMGHTVVAALTPVIYSDFYTESSLGRSLVFNSLVTLVAAPISSSISSIFLTSGLPWQAALLPSLSGLIPLFIILLFAMPTTPISHHHKSRGYIGDIKHLLTIKSYLCVVAGASFASIYTKASTFWMPTVVYYAWSAVGEKVFGSVPYAGVMTINSMLSLAGSFIGIPLFMYLAESWQYGSLCGGRKFNRAMPFIIALLKTITLFVAILNIFSMTIYYPANMICQFLIPFLSTPISSLVQRIILSVSPRGQRATACALLTLIEGIVNSPSAQIIGFLSDFYRGESEDARVRFDAMAFAFYIIMSVLIAASVLYFATMIYYPEDIKNRAAEEDKPLLCLFDTQIDDRFLDKFDSYLDEEFV